MTSVQALIVSLTIVTVALSGCSSVVSATRDDPIHEDPTKRTFGSMIEDQSIETKARVNINKAHPDLAEARIIVASHNGIVLLAGQVPSNEMRELAAQTASELREVRRVHNELTVMGRIGALARSNDSWITTRVKTRLLANSDVAGRRVRVVTENGVVYLMGLITRADAEIASGIASETNGVQKVVRIFEYID